MARVKGFIGPLSSAASPGVELLQNLYPELTGDKDRPWKLIRRPGLSVFASGLHGPVRGGVELDGECHVIAGQRWYSVAANGTATEIGTVAPDTRPAYMVSNGTAGNQVAGISGGNLYVYNRSTGAFGIVSDTDLPGDILGLAHTDTYLITWFRNSRAFRYSSLLDFTAWAGADVNERSQYLDNIVAVIADQTELTILGSQTNETWWNDGTPFVPVPNALGQQGAAASGGACLVGDTPYWVGKSKEGMGPVFRVRGGYTPEKVSTHYIDRRIQALAVLSDAYAYGYEEHGHRFYVLTFPNADVTLGFDEAMPVEDAWHERTFFNVFTGQAEAHLGRCHFYAFGKHLIGSRKDGTIYEQSLAYRDDAGTPIRSTRRFRGPFNEGKAVFASQARLDCHVGVGLTSGQGSDPQVMFRKSRDGGKTWGNERWKSLGAIGAHGTQVTWNKVGYAKDPGWEVVVTDPVVTEWHDFHVLAEGAR